MAKQENKNLTFRVVRQTIDENLSKDFHTLNEATEYANSDEFFEKHALLKEEIFIIDSNGQRYNL